MGFMDKQFAKQKADFDKLTEEVNAGYKVPESIDFRQNIKYLDDNESRHTLDLLLTRETNSGKQPLIINVHGGGLIIGSKEFNTRFNVELYERGFNIVSIEYRLIPDVQVYDQYNDIINALKFIENHLDEWNIDKNKVYIVGDSAGAYLILYCLAIMNNSKMQHITGCSGCDIDIKAAGLISGMFYTRRFDEIGLFLPKYLYGTDNRAEAFEFYTHPDNKEILDNVKEVPLFMTTSKCDKLHKYTTDMYKALVKNGNTVELLDLQKDKRLDHAFPVFHPEYDESRSLIIEMCDYFKSIKTSNK